MAALEDAANTFPCIRLVELGVVAGLSSSVEKEVSMQSNTTTMTGMSAVPNRIDSTVRTKRS